MNARIYRTIGALALMGSWVALPAGRVLGTSDSLIWLLTALGLMAGSLAGWLVQHMLHRPMTRQQLTGAGWAASVLLFVGLFNDAVTGPQSLAHLAVIVGCSGSLAWGVRLLLAPVADVTHAHKESRNLLVGIKTISHLGDEVPPPHPAPRTTPISTLHIEIAKAAATDDVSRARHQKTG